MPRKRKYLNTKYPGDFDNSEYEAEHITHGYADKNGIPYSLRFVLGGIIILLLLIGFFMIYTNQSSQGFRSGGRYGGAYGKPNSINGYGVLACALAVAIIACIIYWPWKREKRHKR